MAFNLAENLGINYKFNREKKLARYNWPFKRHPDLRVQNSEDVSMNEVKIESCF